MQQQEESTRSHTYRRWPRVLALLLLLAASRIKNLAQATAAACGTHARSISGSRTAAHAIRSSGHALAIGSRICAAASGATQNGRAHDGAAGLTRAHDFVGRTLARGGIAVQTLDRIALRHGPIGVARSTYRQLRRAGRCLAIKTGLARRLIQSARRTQSPFTCTLSGYAGKTQLTRHSRRTCGSLFRRSHAGPAA